MYALPPLRQLKAASYRLVGIYGAVLTFSLPKTEEQLRNGRLVFLNVPSIDCGPISLLNWCHPLS